MTAQVTINQFEKNILIENVQEIINTQSNNKLSMR